MMRGMLDGILTTPFAEFAAILFIAAVVGGLATLLRQPLIVAFIAVGIIVGPAWLGIVSHAEQLELLAGLGIAVLLFVVGLRLDVEVIRTLGPVALATGLGQVAFTSIIGFFICIGLGMNATTSLYVAVALTFSSTIIIVKLLSDKREIDALHGRIAVGYLIVQDIVVILLMIALSAFNAGAEADRPLASVLMVVLKGLGLLTVLAALMKYAIPWLSHQMARHQELLLLFGIAWAAALAAVAELAGFSREVGAFLAGVSLASSPFRESLSARLTSVRDFLLLFFFIHLGATLDVKQIGAHVGAAAILSVFVLIGKPLILGVIMGLMGYRRRTGFLTALTTAQISEFSLILAAVGFSLGHLDAEGIGLITLVGLITIGLSTYMILYSHRLFEWLSSPLRLFEKRVPYREIQDAATVPMNVDVIVFGLGRYGDNLARVLRHRGQHVMGVDFDPQVVNAWKRAGHAVQYGDAEDPEFAATLPLSKAQWVVSTMPQLHVNKTLLRSLREAGFSCKVALAAHSHRDAEALKHAGADVVLLPFVDAAVQAADVILGYPAGATE